MIDISAKRVTRRTATAEAFVRCQPATIQMIRDGGIPKGDVLSVSRAVGLLAVKQVPLLLPFCHPISVEHTEVQFSLGDDYVRVEVSAVNIGRTGIEVECMSAASLVALNVYDMLKPVDKEISITDIRVLRKKGGKTDFKSDGKRIYKAAVIVVSDSVSAGTKKDTAGQAASERLAENGFAVSTYAVVPDEADRIQALVRDEVDGKGVDLFVAVGGTGLGPRDRTIEALEPMLERQIPGIAEAMRSFGMERTPYAALSRSIAGQRKRSIVLGVPGSTNGARESMDALLPWLTHVFHVFDLSYTHDDDGSRDMQSET